MRSGIIRAGFAVAAILGPGGLVAPKASLAAGQGVLQPDRGPQILEMQFESRKFHPPPPPISGTEADHAYGGTYGGAFGTAGRSEGAIGAPSGGTPAQ